MDDFPYYVMADELINTLFIFRENKQEIQVRLDDKHPQEWEILTKEEAIHILKNYKIN